MTVIITPFFRWAGQLARKYPPDLFPCGVVVPVVRSVLADFDVVYAPLISSYGSCTGESRCHGPTYPNPTPNPWYLACKMLVMNTDT